MSEDKQIVFTVGFDARFPARSILVGRLGNTELMASFIGNRGKAEAAIRRAFLEMQCS